jgi:hypothetical protein
MNGKKMQVPFPTSESPPKEGILVGVSESTEKWSEFTLEDGTVMRIKPNVVGAIRIEGEYDPAGNPAYILQAQPTVLIVSSEEKLKKGQGDVKIKSVNV